MQLQEIDVSAFRIKSNPCNFRKDLHVFVEYVTQREIKRSYRGNRLSKTDFKRLANMMSAPPEYNPTDDEGYQGYDSWVNFVDKLCLSLGFIDYDSEGRYMGYTSAEPSFPNNYITVSKAYSNFVKLSPWGQEKFLLDTLVKLYEACSNEFFNETPLGELGTFERFGCRTGVLPLLDFAAARKFLFGLLQQCQPDIWHSVESLIQYLKHEHPFFLIPKKPKFKYRGEKNRYGNFHEGKSQWDRGNEVPDHAPDAFERVEGRYVERFLENIPLTLDYLELAYGEPKKAGEFPSRGALAAFKLRPFFIELMKGRINPPKVTVQPNFEVLVELEAWPVALIRRLSELGTVVGEDRHSFVVKLQKNKVLDTITRDEHFDVEGWLGELSSKPLPLNVKTELQEWRGHSEVFTLYEGFALLETTADQALAEPFTVEKISSELRIVKHPHTLYEKLRDAEHMPLRIRHQDKHWQPLPAKSISAFPKTVPEKARKPEKTKVVLHKLVEVNLKFPDKALLERFRNDLIAAGCPLRADMETLTLTFPQAYEKQIKETCQALKQDYQIKIQE